MTETELLGDFIRDLFDAVRPAPQARVSTLTLESLVANSQTPLSVASPGLMRRWISS
jgi:hypothetical protein